MTDKSRAWIGTSWKMNKTLAEAIEFVETLRAFNASPDIQRFVIPPFTAIREVKSRLSDSSILVGAQNMHWEDQGAWTGEISPAMLVDCGIDMVELGHSERREHFGETDERIGQKVKAALEHRLIPLICIGETLQQRDAGSASEVLAFQVRQALHQVVDHELRHQILFAYEPVWAIGEGGQVAEPQYANMRQREISSLSEKLLGCRIPCLYGGSVNMQNCEELIACDSIDGLFIGRAAWDARGYQSIIERCGTVLG